MIEKTMIVIVVFILIVPAVTLSGISENYWKRIQTNDTLDILLDGKFAGMLYSSLNINDGRIENNIYWVLHTFDQKGTVQHPLEIKEKRLFDTNGSLISAYQEMLSPSGKNCWTLSKSSSDTWSILVNTAGVESFKNIPMVKDNLLVMGSIYSGIRDSSITVGDQWADTTLELTTGKDIILTIVCEQVPSEKNGFIWNFICSNNIEQVRESWIVDKNGRTLTRDLNPFKGVRSGMYQIQNHSSTASLFEIYKISVPKRVTKDEKTCLVLDSCDLDSSVLHFYNKDDNRYYLKKMVQKCQDKISLSTLQDSFKIYLRATPTMQISQPEISRLSATLKGKTTSVCALIQKFNNYVYMNIQKQNSATFSSALETLKSGFGDCGEHAVLLAALLRAAGIPARVVMGLVYIESKGGYLYHAWVEAYGGNWIFVDPSHGLFPADFDRIPLIIDDTGEEFLKISQLKSRIKIEHIKID